VQRLLTKDCCLIAECVRLRFWPQGRWKKIALVFFLTLFVIVAAILTLYVVITLVVLPRINMDIVSGIDIINPDGNKTALVVYQPGFTGFPRDVSCAFANGLASSGWKVEITTASSQAPSNLLGYSLLVLGFPVYGAEPGDAIMRYINRTSNLNGIGTVIIALDGFNSPGESIDIIKQKVQALNGTFYESLALWIVDISATDTARRAGSEIAP